MKILITILFLSLLLSSCGVPSDDLVDRNGLTYKKFSEVPFSGKVTGSSKGVLKNGKQEGEWFFYYNNGQLDAKGNFKNGKLEGEWVEFYVDGQLKFKGNYKNSKREGAWISYHKNGQLKFKGNFKNFKREGEWVGYNLNGRVMEENTGTYKNGVKISD